MHLEAEGNVKLLFSSFGFQKPIPAEKFALAIDEEGNLKDTEQNIRKTEDTTWDDEHFVWDITHLITKSYTSKS